MESVGACKVQPLHNIHSQMLLLVFLVTQFYHTLAQMLLWPLFLGQACQPFSHFLALVKSFLIVTIGTLPDVKFTGPLVERGMICSCVDTCNHNG